jgi:holo-[acyl-carrier protein] synthase
MIIGTGIDLVDITRIEAVIKKFGEKFIRRILTPYEIELLQNIKDIERFIATRFSTKEAVSKALGTGIAHGISWKQIELRNNEKGKPFIVLYGNSLEYIKSLSGSNYNINVTISHEKKIVVAMVIIEKI